MKRSTAFQKSAGFTLIEVLVASAILALMALISWRGLDGMAKAQSSLQTRSDAHQTLQVGLSQWRTDLDNMASLPKVPALDWDGRVLRITRQHSQDPRYGAVPTSSDLACHRCARSSFNSPPLPRAPCSQGRPSRRPWAWQGRRPPPPVGVAGRGPRVA